MADANTWSKPFVIDFINMYKRNPCLWQHNHKDYKNKKIRDKACDKLVALCKPLFPGADRAYVMKKIYAFRSTFKKEYKKVRATSKKGKTYVPKLWYYKMLLFVEDQDQPNPVKKSPKKLPNNSIRMLKQEPLDPGYGDIDDSMDSEDDDEESFMDHQLLDSLCLKAITPSSKRPLEDALGNESVSKKQKSTVIDDSQNPNDHPSCSCTKREIDEFEAMGISVSNKLRRMDAFQAICAEFLINSVLKRGLLKTLLPTTTLCENHCNIR